MHNPTLTDESKITMLKLVYFTDLSYSEIGRRCKSSAATVARYAYHVLSPVKIEHRVKRLKDAITQNYLDKNPGAYINVEAPDWYKGVTNHGKVREHIVNWCEANSVTHVKVGYVVHHIDHNRRNNHPSNLQLMTLAQHVSHHHKGKGKC